MRPPGLDTFGLNVALEGLCYVFGARTGMTVSYEGVELPELPTAVALSMYRLVQEALTNIAKHADATRVRVVVSREDGLLSLMVIDDGKGFALDAEGSEPRQRGGIGLVSMHERAELLGGTLQIETAPGSGTQVLVRIPVDSGVEDSQSSGWANNHNGEQR